jgi:dihydrofolate reductase
MPKLGVFNNVSLDGYFIDRSGDMRWAYRNDAEWNEFVRGNASGGGVLLFGRITYQMMASHWPTEAAQRDYPVVASRMNSGEKVVFSRTLDKVTWNNTRLVKSSPVEEVRRMKAEPGEDMVILGSGIIVALLAQAGLIDTYQIAVHPVILGGGRTMFEGVRQRISLKLKSSRAFGNGCVVLTYDSE